MIAEKYNTAANTRFATSAQTPKLLQRLLPADGGIYFRLNKHLWVGKVGASKAQRPVAAKC